MPAQTRSLSGLALLLGLAGLVLLIALAGDLLGLVVVGGVLAYLLLPLVDRMERGGMSRTLATSLLLLGLLVALGGVAALAVPAAASQVSALQARWASGEILQLLANAEEAIVRGLPFVDAGELGLVEAARGALARQPAPLITYVPDAIEVVGNVFLVPFVLFALLKDGPFIRRRLVRFVPNRYFEFAMDLLYKMDAHLGGYLRGQALIALVIAALTSLGLALLGVDYYLVIGIITGLANFVPYVGFFVSAALAVGVSVLTSGRLDEAAGVLALYLGLQTVENVVLQPWITGKNVSLHPALVLFAILVGGRVGGILGMALAVPTAAILKVIVVESVLNLRRYNV